MQAFASGHTCTHHVHAPRARAHARTRNTRTRAHGICMPTGRSIHTNTSGNPNSGSPLRFFAKQKMCVYPGLPNFRSSGAMMHAILCHMSVSPAASPAFKTNCVLDNHEPFWRARHRNAEGTRVAVRMRWSAAAFVPPKVWTTLR